MIIVWILYNDYRIDYVNVKARQIRWLIGLQVKGMRAGQTFAVWLAGPETVSVGTSQASNVSLS